MSKIEGGGRPNDPLPPSRLRVTIFSRRLLELRFFCDSSIEIKILGSLKYLSRIFKRVVQLCEMFEDPENVDFESRRAGCCCLLLRQS